MSFNLDAWIETAQRHIEKAERSQGPMNNEQKAELLHMKTDLTTYQIKVLLARMDEPQARLQ